MVEKVDIFEEGAVLDSDLTKAMSLPAGEETMSESPKVDGLILRLDIKPARRYTFVRFSRVQEKLKEPRMIEIRLRIGSAGQISSYSNLSCVHELWLSRFTMKLELLRLQWVAQFGGPYCRVFCAAGKPFVHV